MAEKTVVRTSGEGQAFWMLGGLYEVLLSGDESNGTTTIMRMTIPAGMGPPPHTHPGAELRPRRHAHLPHRRGVDRGGPGIALPHSRWHPRVVRADEHTSDP